MCCSTAMRFALGVAVCMILLSACAPLLPKREQLVPSELVPARFSPADCHITDSGGLITDNGGLNGMPQK